MYLVLQQREYRVHTGVEHRASYPCDKCGAMLHVLVEARGYGGSTANYDFIGGSVQHQQEAAQRAQVSANGFVHRAMSTAPCPHCGKLPGDGDRVFERDAAKERWRRKLVLPVPLAGGVIATLVGIGILWPDIPRSPFLLGEAVFFGVAAGLLTLAAVLFFPGGVSPLPPAQLFFWLPVPHAAPPPAVWGSLVAGGHRGVHRARAGGHGRGPRVFVFLAARGYLRGAAAVVATGAAIMRCRLCRYAVAAAHEGQVASWRRMRF